MPKRITHELRLQAAEQEVGEFLEQISALGEQLGCLLVQLPPSLNLATRPAKRFFANLRQQCSVPIVCEPRHRSWFTAKAATLLEEFDVGRVVADPPPVPAAATLAGSQRVRYFRWHGSPQVYYSEYSSEFLAEQAQMLQAKCAAEQTWCIFDNTAYGFAIENALELQRRLALR